MHLQNQLIFVVQSQGKYSTSSPATAPEMLATEVTPGLLAGAEPDAHQFNVTICLKGDQMEGNSERYRLNSETRPGMHERVRS
jgi:hypothetical protein